MKAIALREHGGPEVLELLDLPDPTPGPGEALVDIHACALNRLDLWVRGGLPHLGIAYPHILGSDIAGVVRSLGPGASEADRTRWEGKDVVLNPGVSCGHCPACLAGEDNLCPDYRILGENTTGGYAQQIVVPTANLLPKPAGLSMVQAAAVPLTFLTAWQMLVKKARVRPGSTVLLHAVGSGVGSAGLQIAKLHGAKVVALASTDEKLAKGRELGADETLRSDDPTWPKSARKIPWVGRRGFDIVFEHVGQATWPHSIKLTRNGGAIVTCGASSGHEAQTDLRHVFFRQIQILGSTMGSKADLYDVLDHVGTGALKPVVDRTFPLEQAAEAHRYLDRREQFGKVVLEIPR